MQTGDIVHIRKGITTYADGEEISRAARSMRLYVSYVGVGKVLVNMHRNGQVLGWLRNEDVVPEDMGCTFDE